MRYGDIDTSGLSAFMQLVILGASDISYLMERDHKEYYRKPGQYVGRNNFYRRKSRKSCKVRTGRPQRVWKLEPASAPPTPDPDPNPKPKPSIFNKKERAKLRRKMGRIKLKIKDSVRHKLDYIRATCTVPKSDACPICLTETGSVCCATCLYCYHPECIEMWVMQKPICPACTCSWNSRKVIPSGMSYYEYLRTSYCLDIS